MSPVTQLLDAAAAGDPRAAADMLPLVYAELRTLAADPRKVAAAGTAHRYAKAVTGACERAGVEHRHPNRLRHSHATEVRKRYGLEAAGASLGHSQMSATQVYAKRDEGLAEKVAAALG